MLAPGDTVITIDRESFRLSPSLRVAIDLERRWRERGSFVGLFEALNEPSLTACRDVLAACGHDAASVWEFVPADRLATVLSPVGWALSEFVTTCVMVPIVWPKERPEEAEIKAMLADDAAWKNKPVKDISFGDFLESIFGQATGVLGWTPSEAYAATVFEIVSAVKARNEWIGAIFGAGGNKEEELTGTAALKGLEKVG